jgi:hypothetical protein
MIKKYLKTGAEGRGKQDIFSSSLRKREQGLIRIPD